MTTVVSTIDLAFFLLRKKSSQTYYWGFLKLCSFLILRHSCSKKFQSRRKVFYCASCHYHLIFFLLSLYFIGHPPYPYKSSQIWSEYTWLKKSDPKRIIDPSVETTFGYENLIFKFFQISAQECGVLCAKTRGNFKIQWKSLSPPCHFSYKV